MQFSHVSVITFPPTHSAKSNRASVELAHANQQSFADHNDIMSEVFNV
ncbi:hypothetical protein [Vibrio sp. V12_P9A6T4]|nr:hypothetical protein [Vibrio sp. V12_P9A6T4]